MIGSMLKTVTIRDIGDTSIEVIADGPFWFAEGVEFDYAVQGNTLADCVQLFQKGLEATIDLHLAKHGHINNLRKQPQTPEAPC